MVNRRSRSDLVFRGASERKSRRSFAEIKRARFIPQPSGRLLFDSRCDSRDSRHTVRFIPDLPRTRRRLWKLFHRPRGGMGKDTKTRREKERGERRTDGDRDQDRGRKRELEGTNGGGWLMFHHGEWKSGTPWGLGIKMAVTRNRGLCSSCGKPQREEAAWKEPLSSLRSHPLSYFCHIFFPHYLISLFFPRSPSFFLSPLGATLFPPLRPSLSSCFLFAAFHAAGERGRMEISRRGFRCRRFIRMLQMRFGRFLFFFFSFFFLGLR